MTNATRILAVMLCLIASGTLGMMSMQILYPAAICLAAVVGWTERYRITVSRKAESRLAAGVAVLFALRWLLPAPAFGSARVQFISIGILDYAQAYPIAQALLFWMVLLLFLRRGGALPFTLPLYPSLVVILAGTMPPRALGAWSGAAYQTAALALALTSGAYFVVHAQSRYVEPQHARRARRNAYILVLAIVLSLGWGLGRLLQSRGQDLDLLLVDLMRDRSLPTSPGFSGEGHLDRVNQFKSMNSNAIALHVTSAAMPGYLRGKAFDTFDGRRWSSVAPSQDVQPIKMADGRENDTTWFPLAPGGENGDSEHMLVEPVSSLRGAVFTQLESARVGIPRRTLSVDAHRIVEAGQIEPGAPYRVAGVRAADAPLTADERESLTIVPNGVDPKIRAIAYAITRNCADDEARMHAVVAYLNATCTYSLNPPPVVSDNPLSAFLLESRAGHCELFATSAAMLLRCAGVPCRYVTGFVAGEQNSYGEYWVARNKDAHAWVEAYIEGSGWTIVEATPADGVPQREQKQKLAEFWEYAVHRTKSAIAAIRNMNARELANAAVRLLIRWSPWIGAIVLVGVAAILIKRIAAKRRAAVAALGTDPTALAMNRRLRAMDRKAAKLGLSRGPSETLNRFADRADQERQPDLAQWYRVYANARYGNDAGAIAVVLGQQRVP